MASAAPTMEVSEYVSEDGKPHLDIVMTATAGIKGKDERILDWEPITRTNGPFGLVESECSLPRASYHCQTRQMLARVTS